MEEDHIKDAQQRYITDNAQSMTGLYYTPIVLDGLMAGAVFGLSAILDVTKPGTDLVTLETTRVAPVPRAA